MTITFENKPLGEVLKYLQEMQGVNIVPDKMAMQESLIGLDQPISTSLQNVPLKSALNLILHDAKLTHVIRDDVIYVTTEKYAHDKLVSKVYQVTDLVIPILQANPADAPFLPTGGRASDMQNMSRSLGGVQPYNPPNGLNSTGQQLGNGGCCDPSVETSAGTSGDADRHKSAAQRSLKLAKIFAAAAVVFWLFALIYPSYTAVPCGAIFNLDFGKTMLGKPVLGKPVLGRPV